MGLQSAMTTALTGLQAAETTIDVVAHDVDRRLGGLQAGERRRHCGL